MAVPHFPTVLVIDSGIGGMSIVKQMRVLSENVNTLYIADNAFFPYGDLPHDVILSRLKSLICMMQQSHAIDAVVIGCNTATVLMIDKLRDAFAMPFVGIVPAIKTAAAISQERKFTLLATQNTAQSRYLDGLIDAFAQDCEVLRVGCPGLAEIAEEKIYGHPVSQARVEGIFERLCTKSQVHLNDSDVILLGCTHYAYVLPELKKHFSETQLVLEPSLPVAKRLMWVLENQRQTTGHSLLKLGESSTPSAQSVINEKNCFYFTAPSQSNPAFITFLQAHGFGNINILAHLP